MKLGIPAEGGQVFQHFGRALEFAIVEIDQGKVINIKTLSAEGLQHRHEGLAGLLRQQGVEAVIVGGIGPGAIQAMNAAGIGIYTGASGAVADAARRFAEGRFESKPFSCGHGKCQG